MRIKRFEQKENVVHATFEASNQDNEVLISIQFSMPDVSFPEYLLLEKEQLTESMQSFVVCIPSDQTRHGFQVMLNYVTRLYDWPVSVTNTNHPGFPGLLVQFNESFVSKSSLETLSTNILHGIKDAQVSSVVIEEMTEPEDFEDFPETHVAEDDHEPIEWEEGPFQLGEIVDEVEGVDDDE